MIALKILARPRVATKEYRRQTRAALAVLTVYSSDFFCCKTRRKHNFQHLDVRAVTQFAVANTGRLVDARSGLKANNALSFIFEFDPAFQNINELKLCPVKVRLTGEVLSRRRPDDMRVNPALRCRFDTKVAVFIERTKTAFKLGILRVRRNKALNSHAVSSSVVSGYGIEF